jgi:hypothetical protein
MSEVWRVVSRSRRRRLTLAPPAWAETVTSPPPVPAAPSGSRFSCLDGRPALVPQARNGVCSAAGSPEVSQIAGLHSAAGAHVRERERLLRAHAP